MSLQKHTNLLGFKAKDSVTGLAGVITSVSFDLYGCIQAAITPPAKDGKYSNGKWFDVTRLCDVSESRVPLDPGFIGSHQKHINLLGLKAKDCVSGLEGVITSITFELNGIIQGLITPPAKDGGCKSNTWIEVDRFKMLSKKPVMKLPDYDKGYIAEGKKGAAEKPLPS